MTDTSREALIRRALVSMNALNSRIMEPFYCSLDQDAARVLIDCVEMLDADDLELEATTRQVEILSDELSKCSKQAQAVEPVGFANAGELDQIKGGYAHLYPAKTAGASVPLFTHQAPPAQQVAVPEGYALVPIEPTDAMIAAGRATPCTDEMDVNDDYRAVYKAMLAAAQGDTP